MVAQLYKFTKNHWILYSQWVNLMVFKLYPNKAVKKNQEILYNSMQINLKTQTKWLISEKNTTY